MFVHKFILLQIFKVMKTALALMILLHGMIHLLGFLKANKWARLDELTLPISPIWGMAYLIAGMVMVTTAGLYYFQLPYWWGLAMLGVLLSQILVVFFWQDARFGSIPNGIILLIAAVGLANFSFHQTTKQEAEEMLRQGNANLAAVITEDMLSGLPLPVQKWLRRSNITEKPPLRSVYLKQKYQLKMKQDQKDWYEATADQHSTIDPPGFIWNLDMNMMRIIPVAGRDQFRNGKGQMLIKLMSVIPVVNEKENIKIDQGSLQRYLGEMVWYPSAALSQYIIWESIDDTSAKATLTYKNTSGSGFFYFNDEGDVTAFSAKRYMGSGPEAVLHEWRVDIQEFKEFDGIRVPKKSTVTWKFPEGDWTWAILEITDAKYNYQ